MIHDKEGKYGLRWAKEIIMRAQSRGGYRKPSNAEVERAQIILASSVVEARKKVVKYKIYKTLTRVRDWGFLPSIVVKGLDYLRYEIFFPYEE